MPLPLPRALTALALFCTLASPAAAQEPTEIPFDTWVTGVLTEEASPEYRLPADFTGWVEIVLESGDFDTFATWIPGRDGVGAGGDSGDEIFNDDDGGLTHSTDSRIRTEVTVAGAGVFVVSSYGASGQGEYRLRATVIQGPAPPTPLAYGDDVSGDLVDLDWAGDLVERYEFQGTAGEEVWVVLESRDFDAVLSVLGVEDGETELAWDDDGFAGTDAALQTVLPATGAYRILVSSYSGGGGSYRLRLGVGSETAPERLREGTAWEGAGPSDSVWDESVPSTWVLSRGELAPAAEMPQELVMMPRDLAPMVEDGSRLINEALGFDLPSPGPNSRRVEGDELVELRGDVSEDFFGVETPPTNFGIWFYGFYGDPVQQDDILIVMALKSDAPLNAEAVTAFGGLFLQIDGGDIPLQWMDIQWEESRSAAYRFDMDRIGDELDVDRDGSYAMRCTAGRDRETGGLIVCAVSIAWGAPGSAEEIVSGLRVR